MHRLTAEDDRHYLGETMGLDEAQKQFATRLVTGEALIYGDELPEALQVEIKPELALRARMPPACALPRSTAAGRAGHSASTEARHLRWCATQF